MIFCSEPPRGSVQTSPCSEIFFKSPSLFFTMSITTTTNPMSLWKIESGVDLRYIKELLRHKHSKTTEIYTRVSTKNLSKIRSPLDMLGGDMHSE